MSNDTANAERESRQNLDSTALPVPELPKRVLLDLRTDCNLKCPMCIVHGETDDPRLKAFLRQSMPLEAAREILDQVMSAKPLVQPNLWSEPLLVRNFQEYARMMKERGLAVAMNTNGLTLTRPLAETLVDIMFDSICFSIDATTKETLKKVRGIDRLDKIHRAVDLMIEVRGDKTHPRVGVSFTIQDANRHEHDDFIGYWAPKVDFVRVGEIYEEEKGGFPGIKLVADRVPCKELYSTMAIHTNGNVSICCLDGFGETNMGNVLEEGVKEVWHGAKFTQIRHLHETGQYDQIPMCKNCDRWASHDYKEEVRDGMLIRRSAEYTYYNRLEKLETWGSNLLGTHSDPHEVLAEIGQTAVTE